MLAHPEGGRNDYVHQLPVRHTYPKIVLSRGMVRDPGLFFWYQAGLTQSIGARRDGAIILLTASGMPALGWIFRGGLACGWKGPQLKGSENAVAVESIEIAHEGLLQVPITPRGSADDHDRQPPDPVRRRPPARRGRVRRTCSRCTSLATTRTSAPPT